MDAELVDDHLGGLTDSFGEGGKGELELGDILDAHPPTIFRSAVSTISSGRPDRAADGVSELSDAESTPRQIVEV